MTYAVRYTLSSLVGIMTKWLRPSFVLGFRQIYRPAQHDPELISRGSCPVPPCSTTASRILQSGKRRSSSPDQTLDFFRCVHGVGLYIIFNCSKKKRDESWFKKFRLGSSPSKIHYSPPTPSRDSIYSKVSLYHNPIGTMLIRGSMLL